MARGGCFLINSLLNFTLGLEKQDQSSDLILKPEPHFIIGGNVCALRINRSAQAKRMKLQVKATREVVLVLPKRVALKRGLAFAAGEYAWICEQVGRLEKPVPLVPGNYLPILGEEHQIVHVPKARGYVWQEEGKLFVTGGEEHVSRRVTDWSKKEIKKIITVKTEKYAQELQVDFRRISIRDQKSRWGSCSSDGNLNFSWRLILMPEEIVDYVVAHEVAHLRHMDHSPQFWNVLQKVCPKMDENKNWLKKHGTSMHKYGATF